MSKRLTNIQWIGLLLTGILAAAVIILMELRAESGERTVENGERTVESGQLTVESGELTVENGELRTDSTKDLKVIKDLKDLKGSPGAEAPRDFLDEEF